MIYMPGRFEQYQALLWHEQDAEELRQSIDELRFKAIRDIEEYASLIINPDEADDLARMKQQWEFDVKKDSIKHDLQRCIVQAHYDAALYRSRTERDTGYPAPETVAQWLK